MGRVAAFGVAGVFLFGGCSVLEGVDKGAWSAGEVREAAEGAGVSLAAEPQIHRDAQGGYASLIEAEFMRVGEGQGPSYEVVVEQAGDDYEISAGGADTTVCLHVTEAKSAGGGVFVPGADSGSTSIPAYDLTATVDDGPC